MCKHMSLYFFCSKVYGLLNVHHVNTRHKMMTAMLWNSVRVFPLIGSPFTLNLNIFHNIPFFLCI